jgi:predicted  nucleic acid-binding Zn ribbon protein
MQKKIKRLHTLLLVIFTTTVSHTQPLESYAQMTTIPWFRVWANPPRLTHAQEVIQDNEWVRNDMGKDANFHTNPLQINGRMLDYNTFDLSTKGMLTVVKGNPTSKEAQAIPFSISIRRNGEILTDKKMSFLNKTLYKVNLSDIFPFSQHGDILIVNPARVEDWKGKRLLKLLGGC